MSKLPIFRPKAFSVIAKKTFVTTKISKTFKVLFAYEPSSRSRFLYMSHYLSISANETFQAAGVEARKECTRS